MDFNKYKEEYPEPKIDNQVEMKLEDFVNHVFKEHIPNKLSWLQSYNYLSYYAVKTLFVFFFSKLGLQDIIINKSDFIISPNSIQILPLLA